MKVIIEIPKHSFIKYELDSTSNTLICDRILKIPIPQNYGFIPNTKAQDGDELDIVLILDYSLHPKTIIDIKIIGYLEMEDEKGIDEKVIVVPISSNIENLKDIKKHILDEIKEFFIHYKDHEKDRWSKVGDFMRKNLLLNYMKSIKFSQLVVLDLIFQLIQVFEMDLILNQNLFFHLLHTLQNAIIIFLAHYLDRKY